MPDTVTALGTCIAKQVDIVLPKSLKFLNGDAFYKCINVFFPEGISKSLKYINSLAGSCYYFCADTEKAALDKLFAVNNYGRCSKSVSKREITLDYGTRTEKINDYYAILPDISNENTVLHGWLSEYDGNEKMYYPEKMFIPDNNPTATAITVKRSAHDGFTPETAAAIDSTIKDHEIYASYCNGLKYSFYFKLKTDKPIMVKISIEERLWAYNSYFRFCGMDNLPLSGSAMPGAAMYGSIFTFIYQPGEIYYIETSQGGNDNYPEVCACKVKMNIEIIDL